jgi:hypothetical protein
MLSPGMDVRIDLNSDTFGLADKDELAERLRAETDLRIESDVAAYAGVEGGPLPPDVVIYILYTLVPVADIYANVLASAIWDRVKAALARQGKDGSGVTFSLVEMDDDGNMRREVSGETRDPEAIKELIRQFDRDR